MKTRSFPVEGGSLHFSARYDSGTPIWLSAFNLISWAFLYLQK